MTDQTEVKFADLTLDQRIEAVNGRIGDHPNRISHPSQLLDLKGQTVYMVLSPFGKTENIGSAFLLEWVVGDIKDQLDNVITSGDEFVFDDEHRYLCYHDEQPDIGMSLRDINIVPNSYNNHAVFSEKESAEAYIMYRKMMFETDSSIEELEGDYVHYFTVEDIVRLRTIEEEQKEEGA